MPRIPPLPLVTALALLASACMAPDEYVLEADDAAYTIIQQRRDALAAGDPFTIEAPEGTLRQRLLEGHQLTALTLSELLIAAAENSRTYQDRRESLYLAALDLTLERWRFSWQPDAGATASVDGNGEQSGTAGVLSTVGVSKLLGSGAQVAGDVSVDIFRDIGSGDGWDAVSNLSLNISQPLLRGFGSQLVLEPLTQAERNVLYEARVYERFRRTFAYDVVSRFFGILRQVVTLSNERENAYSLTVLRERNEAFAEAGQLNEIEVDQARQNELSARNRVITAQRNLETQLDDFKLLLGLPIDVELPLDAADNLTLERWSFLLLDPPAQRVIDVALARRFDYLTSLQRVEDAGRKVAVAADDLRAGLDVVLSGNATSPEGKPANLGGGADRPWRLALDLDLPINNLPERNAYRESLITFKQAERSAQESADNITADLRDALRRLAAARESYGIQQNAVQLAERRVESTELNLEAGRASTRDVLESKDSLLQARNALTAELTDYILSGLALYRDMELLRVAEDGVSVDVEPLLELETPGNDP